MGLFSVSSFYLGPIPIERLRFCLTLVDHAPSVTHLDTKTALSTQTNPVLGSSPVVINSVDEPCIYMALFIPGYVVLHSGGIGLSQRWNGLPMAVDEVEAEGVGSPSARNPMSAKPKGGLGEY